jgi:acyl transferase domain-containing protein
MLSSASHGTHELENPSVPSNHLHAVICGTAVNQDGRSSGLTAPNGPSQTSLLLKTLQQSTAPETLGYLATHGTGMSLASCGVPAM